MCLSALIESKKINTVWTTNFDDLIEKAITALNFLSCQVVSPDNARTVHNFRSDIPDLSAFLKVEKNNTEIQIVTGKKMYFHRTKVLFNV
jgi:hypothetical protein